jgi:pseudouridine-5'-phosphate glycosidase
VRPTQLIAILLDIPAAAQIHPRAYRRTCGLGLRFCEGTACRRSATILSSPGCTCQAVTEMKSCLKGGALVANPVAAEDEIPSAEMSGYIDRAVAEAMEKRVTG